MGMNHIHQQLQSTGRGTSRGGELGIDQQLDIQRREAREGNEQGRGGEENEQGRGLTLEDCKRAAPVGRSFQV